MLFIKCMFHNWLAQQCEGSKQGPRQSSHQLEMVTQWYWCWVESNWMINWLCCFWYLGCNRDIKCMETLDFYTCSQANRSKRQSHCDKSYHSAVSANHTFESKSRSVVERDSWANENICGLWSDCLDWSVTHGVVKALSVKHFSSYIAPEC